VTDAETVPLVRYQDVLWAIDVRAAGRDGLFLLDTGAGHTCLDAALAAEAGCETFGRLTGHRMTGERVDLDRTDGIVVRIGSCELPAETVAVTDIAGFLPPDWPRVSGAVGLDLFADRPVTMDFGAGLLHLETEESLAARVADLAPLRIGLARSGGGLALEVFVAARAAPGLLWLQVDSGNTGPAILAPHAAALLGVSEEPDGPVSIDLPDLGPTPLEVVVKEIIYDGSLGQGFLAGRALALDLARGRAWVGGG
jgi:hypothetical protein